MTLSGGNGLYAKFITRSMKNECCRFSMLGERNIINSLVNNWQIYIHLIEL